MPARRISQASLVLVGALAALPLSAHAKDDFITLDVGAYNFRSRDNIAVGGATGRGTEFQLERENSPSNDTVLRVDGTIRPFERHRIRFMWLDSSREGEGVIDRSISFRDASYTLGSRVSTSFRLQQTELDYMYSFWKTDEIEAALTLGIHASHMELRLSAPSLSLSREASVNGPLPMVGVALNWQPHEKWELFGHLYGMSATIGDYSGHAVGYRLGGRYYITSNIGLGLAYAGINYKFDVDRSSWLGTLDASHRGGQAFLSFRY
jgi:hypothetical protein